MSRSPDRSDRALRIRTTRCVRTRALRLPEHRVADARDYQPTPPEILDDVFIDLDLPPERFTFVDLGSGKGRVVFLATARPFRRAIGVELSPLLHADALTNLASFSPPWTTRTRVEFVHADAADFTFPREPLVVFLYNPFSERVLRAVVQNLERSLDESPREVFVVYFEPVHAELFERSDRFEPAHHATRWRVFNST